MFVVCVINGGKLNTNQHFSDQKFDFLSFYIFVTLERKKVLLVERHYIPYTEPDFRSEKCL